MSHVSSMVVSPGDSGIELEGRSTNQRNILKRYESGGTGLLENRKEYSMARNDLTEEMLSMPRLSLIRELNQNISAKEGWWPDDNEIGKL